MENDLARVAAAPDLTQSSPTASPPITLRAVRERLPWLLLAVVVLVLVLGALAAIGDGRWLVWDEPITKAAVDLRTPGVNRFALWISRLGSTPVVLAAGVALVLLAARKSRAVALVMLITVAARPPLEWLLKEMASRPRPSGDRLVPGTGFSFPSGHVLAAAATWGFVPVIASLYIKRRWVWSALRALVVGVIVLMAWCRVWLGVHWTSDVVGSLAIAFVGLSIAEAAIDHRRVPDAPVEPVPDQRTWADERPELVASGTRTSPGNPGVVGLDIETVDTQIGD